LNIALIFRLPPVFEPGGREAKISIGGGLRGRKVLEIIFGGLMGVSIFVLDMHKEAPTAHFSWRKAYIT
jgi:hypothetical protein